MMLYCLWFLQLQDAREELKAATGIEVTHLDICSFQEEWPSLLSDLSKITYPARYSSQDVLTVGGGGGGLHLKPTKL